MKPAVLPGLQSLPVEEGIPTESECKALWLRFGVPDEVVAYSRMVAELARIFAVYLRLAGLRFNIGLIMAGGYLNHLIKRPPNNGRFAEATLRQTDRELNEADLIRLAEQCVAESELCFLDAACQASPNPHGYQWENDDQTSKINARIIRDRVEKILGVPVKDIVRKHRRGILAVSVQGIRNVYLLAQGTVGLKTDGLYIREQELSLSSEGIHQAEALREKLQDVPLSSIYCSDLKSAIQTATIIAEPHLLRPGIRAGFREIGMGDAADLISAEAHQLYARQPGQDMLFFRPPGGESLFDCTARVIPAFYDILNSTFGNMAIVGHPVVNRIILCQVLGVSLERLFEIEQSYGVINHIYCDGSKMRLKSINGYCRPYNRLN